MIMKEEVQQLEEEIKKLEVMEKKYIMMMKKNYIKICPFHRVKKSSSYCLIGDCIYSEDEKCPIFIEHFRIVSKFNK